MVPWVPHLVLTRSSPIGHTPSPLLLLLVIFLSTQMPFPHYGTICQGSTRMGLWRPILTLKHPMTKILSRHSWALLRPLDTKKKQTKQKIHIFTADCQSGKNKAVQCGKLATVMRSICTQMRRQDLKKNAKRLGLAASQDVKGFKLGGLSLGSMVIQ